MVSSVVPLPVPDPEEIARLLKQLRDVGVSTKRVARYLDIDPATLHKYASGKSEPTWRVLRALERELELAEEKRMPRIPLPIVAEVSAGTPAPTDEEVLGYRMVPADRVRRGRSYLLRVNGESMVPTLAHGDLLVVNVDLRELGHTGDLLVVRSAGEIAVRRLRREKTGDVLEADAPGYEPLPRDDLDVDVLGLVTGVVEEGED